MQWTKGRKGSLVSAFSDQAKIEIIRGREIPAVLETAQHLLNPTPADAEQFGSFRLGSRPTVLRFDELAA